MATTPGEPDLERDRDLLRDFDRASLGLRDRAELGDRDLDFDRETLRDLDLEPERADDREEALQNEEMEMHNRFFA